MKHSFPVAGRLAALALLAAPALAHADSSILGWSYANVAAGSCTAAGPGCTPASGHPPVYPHIQINQGFDHNSVAFDTDPTFGNALGFADTAPSSFSVGGASFRAPELNAFVSGFASRSAIPYSWNYAFTEAVQGYLWNGPDTTISLNTFVGTLHDMSNEQTFGQVAGSLALLTDAADGRGATWAATNNGLFTADCSTPGAGGIATTGIVPTGTGARTTTLTAAQRCTGSFELQTGHRFYIWSQLEVFDLGGGFIDASNGANSFTVDFAADADPALKALITENSVAVGAGSLAVPEPSAWALMILGMGAVGGAMRRSRGTAARLPV